MIKFRINFMKKDEKMRLFISLFVAMCALTACNSVYVQPNSLDKDALFFAQRGGYTMRRSVKEAMQERGYNVVVGTADTSKHFDDGDESNIDIDTDVVPKNAKYIVRTYERKDFIRPVWCMFNGFWWWNFNVSIADQETGHEIMTWRGRGCANSSIRKLNKILDKMEKPSL